jgi:hypothetical protein
VVREFESERRGNSIPFSKPAKPRAAMANGNVTAKPKNSTERRVPPNPIKRTGFLPIRSEM